MGCWGPRVATPSAKMAGCFRFQSASFLWAQGISWKFSMSLLDTVDGRFPANQLRLVVYPLTYRGLCIPGGAGFLPSRV